MFKHVKVGKHIEHMRQKLSKNMLIIKLHPGMNCLCVFFFIPGWNFIPAILTGMSSPRDLISSRQKRVNNKRHFTIDRDDFVSGWNFPRNHPLNFILGWNLEGGYARNFIPGWNHPKFYLFHPRIKFMCKCIFFHPEMRFRLGYM